MIVSDNSPRTYSQLVSSIRMHSEWKDYHYREKFKDFFFFNDNAESLFDTLFTKCYRTPDQESLQLCTKLIREKKLSYSEEAKVYHFFKTEELYNPFSVLRGRGFYIFPYSRYTFSHTNTDYSFRTVKYTKSNPRQSFIYGIHVARILQTFLDVPKINLEYRLELAPSPLRSPYDYKVVFDDARHVVSIFYGASLYFESVNHELSLLGRIERQLEECEKELIKDCPEMVSWEIRQHVRNEFCYSAINQCVYDYSLVRDATNYPFYFSVYILSDFERHSTGIPFRINQ